MTQNDADSHSRGSGEDQDRLPALEFAAGEWIYRRGQRDDCMYVIESGSVELVLTDPHGHAELRLMVLQRGDFVGELGVLDESRRTSCARALEDCRLLPLGGAELQKIVEEQLSLAFRMLRSLALRHGQLETQLFGLWSEHFHEKVDTVPPDLGSSGAQPVSSGTPGPTEEPEDTAETRKVVQPEFEEVDPEFIVTEESRWRRGPIEGARHGRARLVAMGEGLQFLLGERDETTIGRSSRSGSLVPDIDLSPLDHERTVSRRHATIYRGGDDGYTLLEHEGVANGTSVNGLRLTPGQAVSLRDGDRICFGTIILVFRAGWV